MTLMAASSISSLSVSSGSFPAGGVVFARTAQIFWTCERSSFALLQSEKLRSFKFFFFSVKTHSCIRATLPMMKILVYSLAVSPTLTWQC